LLIDAKNYSNQVGKFSSKILVFFCFTMLESHGSSLESDGNSESNRSGSATSLCSFSSMNLESFVELRNTFFVLTTN